MSAASVQGQLAAGVLGVASGASWRLSGDAVELLELQPLMISLAPSLPLLFACIQTDPLQTAVLLLLGAP
jgi:hypothetical protein